MRNKITKRAREEAILICDVSASMPTPTGPQETYTRVAADLGLATEIGKSPGLDLAYTAWSVVQNERRGDKYPTRRYWPRATDAEAAALLREGWCPGDEVVRL